MSPYSPDITTGGGEQREKSSPFVSVPASHMPNHSIEEYSLGNSGPPSPISSPSAAAGGVGGAGEGWDSATAPFPSASDILQPLSQLAPLPTSGHVAAAVSRGLKLDWTFGTATNTFYPGKGQGSSQTALQPGSHGADSDLLYSDEFHPTIPVENEDPVSGAEAFHHAAPVSRSASAPSQRAYYCQPPPFPGTVVYGPPFCGSFLFAPVVLKDEEVQKRNETVQFCQECDVEGVRSWRRLIVEYT